MKQARATCTPSITRKAYLESVLFVARSAIDGQGVFTRTPIQKGAAVLECRGVLQHGDEVGDDARAMQVGPNTYLIEDPKNPTVDDFLNHSCQPNLGFVNGSLILFALRDIKPREELLFDYSTTMDEHGWAIKCRCRSANCRAQVRSYSELPRLEQERLRQIALTYLRR